MKVSSFAELINGAVIYDEFNEEIYLNKGDKILVIDGPFFVEQKKINYTSLIVMLGTGRILPMLFHPDNRFSDYLREHDVQDPIQG